MLKGSSEVVKYIGHRKKEKGQIIYKHTTQKPKDRTTRTSQKEGMNSSAPEG